MSLPEITVEPNEDGTIEIDVKGCTGKRCEELTEALENKLDDDAEGDYTPPQSTEEVLKEMENSQLDPQKAIEEAQKQDSAEKVDVLPVISLGVTMQFMRFCGGRLQAHQMIEDVYQAIRMQVGGNNPGSGEAMPFGEEERQNPVEALKQVIADMEKNP